MQPVVLVTGASGFVGRSLVPVLQQSGYTVRRAMRRARLSDGDFAIDTVGPTTDWESAIAGVDTVVHLAARVHHPNEEHAVGLYHAVNTEGAAHLARVAAQAGVRKFIFMSSILVNGSCTDGRGPFTSEDELKPRGVYGRSKAAAEQELTKIASTSQMTVSIIRPPLIYGRDAVGNFQQLAKAVRAGIPLPFGLVNNRRSFVGVENLCSFISTLATGFEGRASNTYLVADPEQISIGEFIRKIGNAMHRSSRLLPIPRGVLEAMIKVAKPSLRDSLLGSLEMDTSGVLATGWKAPFSLDEGLQRALRAP